MENTIVARGRVMSRYRWGMRPTEINAYYSPQSNKIGEFTLSGPRVVKRNMRAQFPPSLWPNLPLILTSQIFEILQFEVKRCVKNLIFFFHPGYWLVTVLNSARLITFSCVSLAHFHFKFSRASRPRNSEETLKFCVWSLSAGEWSLACYKRALLSCIK